FSNVMRCGICGQIILPAIEPIVPTTMGDLVHVACADREARMVYGWRTGRAPPSVGLALILLSFAAHSGIANGVLLLLLGTVAIGMCVSTGAGGGSLSHSCVGIRAKAMGSRGTQTCVPRACG